MSDPKDRAQADVELAAHLVDEADELRLGELQPRTEMRDGPLGQRLASSGEVTHDGRARDLKDRRERIDAESIDEVETHEVAVADVERSERGGKRLAKIDAEALADQRELGVDETECLWPGARALLGVGAVTAAAPQVRQRATRDDLQPGEQRAAATELLDPRRAIDEQARAQDLAELVEDGGLGPLAVEQARELRHDLAVERGDRSGVAIAARAGEIEVADVQCGEGGERIAIADDPRGEKPREPLGLDGDVGPGRRTLGDPGGEIRLQISLGHTPPPYHGVVDACLDDDTVLQLVSGTLRDSAAAQQHLDTCKACRELVASAAPDSTPEWAHLEIGAQLGRYKITAVLGAGAMGYVFAAHDPELGRTVALKLLRTGGAAHSARLLREAQSLAKLSHPNVVAVHDVGTFGDHLFVALEWVDGGTLARWLAEPRTTKQILEVFRQAGEGLAAAHAVGLVHRDVKPDNILVGKDGRARVTDFGLARQGGAPAEPATPGSGSQPTSSDLTRTGTRIGTPAYASPEQVAGADADARSDQFSFCVALFEALHGYRPFPGDDWAELRAALERGTIVHQDNGKRVARWLDRIVARGLRRDPADRWESLRALLDALAKGPLITPARALVGAGTVALAAVATLQLGIARTSPCQPADPGIWSAAAATALRARVPVEVETTIDRAFRSYSAAWTQMSLASCVATKVDRAQTRDAFALRESCLAERRDYARELAGALLEGAAPHPDGAVQVAEGLPSIEECANVHALEAVATPETPVTVVRRAALQQRMARATIEGYLRAGADPRVFGRLADEAHALSLPALEARALLFRAHAETDETAEETALHAAAHAAFAAHDDAALADAWERLVFHTGFHAANFAASAQWFAYAQGAIDRLGGDTIREAELTMSRGWGEVFSDHAADARRDMARARELFIRARGPDYYRIADTLSGEGAAVLTEGKPAEALRLYQQARAHAKRVGGVASQAYITASNNAANAMIDLGQVGEGLALFEELERGGDTSSWQQEQMSAALRTLKRFGDALARDRKAEELARGEHATGPRALYAPEAIGLDLEGLHRPNEALPYFEQVLAAREAGPASPEDLSNAEFEVARALRATAGDAHRARTLAVQARDRLQPLVAKDGKSAEDGIAEISTWLAAH